MSGVSARKSSCFICWNCLGEPAGQIAARELEVARLRHALRRAEELTMDVAAAIEEMAEGAASG